MDTEIRVSTYSRPWRRKFSCRDSKSNPRPFSHESGALTTELSPPPEKQKKESHTHYMTPSLPHSTLSPRLGQLTFEDGAFVIGKYGVLLLLFSFLWRGKLQGSLCRGVGMGSWGKQVGSMDEEPQVRGCYNITFICTPTNQETVSVLEKTQANKTFRTWKQMLSINNSNYLI